MPKLTRTSVRRPTRRRPTTDALEIMDRLWGQRPGHRAAVKRQLEKLALGERIQNAREAQGLTQVQLAKLVGTTQSAIARLEAAEYVNFKLETLLKITGSLKGTVEVHFPATGVRDIRNLRRRDAPVRSRVK